jgi:hypothetical protein
LPAHVFLEAYAVLTRLPAGLAVAAPEAAGVLTRRFPQPPLRLDDSHRERLLDTLAERGVYGGATYDGLVALEAKAHGHVLLTLDERARFTYQRLNVEFNQIG